MPVHNRAIRKGITPSRIEQVLANGPMTIMEIADQLQLALATVRNQIPFTDAIPAGRLLIGNGRPRICYTLRGTPSTQVRASENCDHIAVMRIEKALLLQNMTIPELCRVLSLCETAIRAALPRTGATAIEHRREKRRHGRSPVVYGFLSKAA